MTRSERVMAALARREVDHVPVSFWGHDYLREWSPRGLADATLERYRKYGWDFIKVNPRATCYMEAWGNKYRPSGNAARGPVATDFVLRSPEDLARITPVDSTGGPFGEQIEALSLIADGLQGEAPFIQTVFSPLTVIGRLAGGNLAAVRYMMRQHREALHKALRAVTATLAGYARASVGAGAAGIFYATVDWATFDNATAEQYAEFGRPYDLWVLEAIAEAKFNVLHVCRKHNLLEFMLDYPVQAFNWAAEQADNPGLGEVADKAGKAVMGGVAVDAVSDGTPEQVAAEVKEALEQMGGRAFFLTAGCSVPPQTPEANLRAALEAVGGDKN